MIRRKTILLVVLLMLESLVFHIWQKWWSWTFPWMNIATTTTTMSTSTAPVPNHGESSSTSKTTPTSTRERTLVIVMGSLRGGQVSWETLQRHVLIPSRADLALAIPRQNKTAAASTVLHQWARHVWEFPEYDDWGDAIDDAFPLYRKEWRRYLLHNPEGDICENGLLGGIAGCKGSGIIIFLYRFWIAQKLQHLGLLEQYDRFVLTRSDHYYKCTHNLQALDLSKIWIPEGEDWGGITDRHLVASRYDFLPLLNVLEPLIRHAEQYRHLQDNPEKWLWRQWSQQGLTSRIRRFRRVMFTCQVEGDETRWKTYYTGPLVEDGQVRLKYEEEYYATLCECEVQAPDFNLTDDRNVCCPLGQRITEQYTCQPLPPVTATKSLIIVLGDVPAHAESLRQYVIQPNQADLALAVPEGRLAPDSEAFATWHAQAQYIWEFPHYDDWGTALDEIAAGPEWRDLLLPPVDPNLMWHDTGNTFALCRKGVLGGVAPCARSTTPTAKTWVYQHYVAQALAVVSQHYDWFLVVPPEVEFQCRWEFHLLDPGKIWIPHRGGPPSGWGGWVLLTGPTHASTVLSGLSRLLQHATRYSTLDIPTPFALWQHLLPKHHQGKVRHFAPVLRLPQDDDGAAAACTCSGGAFFFGDVGQGRCLCPGGMHKEGIWQEGRTHCPAPT